LGRKAARPWRFFINGENTATERSETEYEDLIRDARSNACFLTPWRPKDILYHYWMFNDRFYRADTNETFEDVDAYAKVHQSREDANRESIRARAAALDHTGNSRSPIPREIRYAVWERDGGKCVECSSGFDLQYDHIIPVVMGGATSLENLQLLCGDCNRRKSGTLG